MKVHHLGQHRIDSHVEGIRLVQLENFQELLHRKDQLTNCYKEVFAETPYFEDYTGKEDEIFDSFARFMLDGVVVLLVNGSNAVVGFGGCERASTSEVAEFLDENLDKLEVHSSRYIYMAELAVQSRYRRKGFGAMMVRDRLQAIRANPDNNISHVLMRTAKDDSNSIGIYLRLGARVIDGLVQVKTGFDTKSTERVFLSAPLVSLNL